MAGKGTTPLLALRRGFHGIGIEISKASVEEMAAYMDRYFEYHRIKFKHQQSSLTVRGKNGGLQHKWVFSDTTEHFKDGDTRSLRMICGDTRNTLAYLKSTSVHIMVTDLPYGVQTGTAGKEDGILGTVSMALPGWYDTLKSGGVLCMSFNTHTIRRDALVQTVHHAGFTVIETENLEHWVEQAIERDVLIAKKERMQE
jgi:tRNA G10  N-methylase Trm11